MANTPGPTRHYMLAAGGTGGHLIPAFALATELIARGHRVELITDARGAAIPGKPDGLTAHVLPAGGHGVWLQSCAALLRPGGRLALVQRADRLGAILAGLEGGFGAIVLRFVQPRARESAIRVLVRAVKGSRAPLAILPPLVLHDADGAFTPEAAALHRGEVPPA